MANYTITWGNRTLTVNGLPDNKVREWNPNIKVKFYHRGTTGKYRITKTGWLKPPRNETQLYINGKYFLQFSWNLSKDNEAKIMEMIRYLYCFGCDLDEIKRIFKKAFYQPK